MSRVSSLKSIFKPAEVSEDLINGIYQNWSINNIRALLIFDNYVYIRYYAKTKYNKATFVQYPIEPISPTGTNKENSIINLIFEVANNFNTVSGLEEVIVASSNTVALTTEYKIMQQYGANKEVYPRLRSISFCVVPHAFDLRLIFDAFKQAIAENKGSETLFSILRRVNMPMTSVNTIDLHNTDWFKAGVEFASPLKPNWYAADIEGGSVAVAVKSIYDVIAPIVEKENKETAVQRQRQAIIDKAEKDAISNATLLSEFNTMVTNWTNAIRNIIRHRITIEQILTYGRSRFDPDEPNKFIMNCYFNGTISRKLYDSDERHTGTFEERVASINSAYMAEVAKQAGHKELYAFFAKYRNLVSYMSNDYSWCSYLTPDIAFDNKKHTEFLYEHYVDHVNEIVNNCVLSNKTPIKVISNKPKEKCDIIGASILNFMSSTFDTNLTTPLSKQGLKGLDNTTSSVNVAEQLESIQQLMKILFKMELLSCYKLFCEVLPIWRMGNKDSSKVMCKLITNIQCADVYEPNTSVLPLSESTEVVLRTVLLKTAYSNAAIRNAYSYAFSLSAFDISGIEFLLEDNTSYDFLSRRICALFSFMYRNSIAFDLRKDIALQRVQQELDYEKRVKEEVALRNRGES